VVADDEAVVGAGEGEGAAVEDVVAAGAGVEAEDGVGVVLAEVGAVVFAAVVGEGFVDTGEGAEVEGVRGGVVAEDAVGAVGAVVGERVGERAAQEAEGGIGGRGDGAGVVVDLMRGGCVQGGGDVGVDGVDRAGVVVEGDVGTAGVADLAAGEGVEGAVLEGEAAGEGDGGGDALEVVGGGDGVDGVGGGGGEGAAWEEEEREQERCP
jgi:hypothetical protein